MIRAHQPAGILETIHERHLRNHAAHAPVGRSDHDRMGCGITRPPDADLAGFVEGQGKCDCIAIVANLPLRIDLIAWLSVAGTEVAMVEFNRGQTRSGKRGGEFI